MGGDLWVGPEGGQELQQLVDQDFHENENTANSIWRMLWLYSRLAQLDSSGAP